MRRNPPYIQRRIKAVAFVLLALAAGSLAAAHVFAPESTQVLASTLFKKDVPKAPGKITLVNQPDVGTPSAPQPAAQTMVDAAYRAVAPDLAGISPGSVGYARQSIFDPSWGTVRVAAPDRNGYYAVFLHRKGKSWRAEQSVIVDSYTDPRSIEPVLRNIPSDLKEMLFFGTMFPADKETAGERATSIAKAATGKDGWKATDHKTGSRHVVEVENKKDKKLHTRVYLNKQHGLWAVTAVGENLTSAEVPGFPKDSVEQVKNEEPVKVQAAKYESTDPVVSGVNPEKLQKGLGKAQKAVEGYSGIAGFYAYDLKDGFSYGVRPDEEFFSASVIKVPIMVAVFRRIEQGKLSFDDSLKIRDEDKAPGSGGLQYTKAGTSMALKEYLWLMVTKSDNVAANVLVHAVGGRDYVNKVSESLGATDTVLRRKVTVERAAVPTMDNQTTPKDMATILVKIYNGQAASKNSCRQMIDLLHNNNEEIWLEGGVPPDIPVANKGGWLDSTFNDVGIVEYKNRPYVLAMFTKYGANDIYAGGQLLAGISKDVWNIESGDRLNGKSESKKGKGASKKK